MTAPDFDSGPARPLARRVHALVRRVCRWRTLAVASVLAPLVAACSPWALIERSVPTDTYRLSPDIAYGTNPRQRLDVYSPLDTSKPGPVLVFIYGGAWNSGNRDFYRFVGEALASRGIVTVIPDYRVYPEVKFPGFVEDSAQAIGWALKNVARFGGDPKRLNVGGHSAGAYNAAMVAFDPRYAKAAGFDSTQIAGFVGLAGPYDFLPLTGRITRQVFGYPDTSPDTQPINFVSARAPRSLLMYAVQDNLVGPHNSENLASKLREARVDVSVVQYDKLGHRTLVASIARPLHWMGNTADEIAAFVR
jgi:acetyl esterase/lipase